MGYSASEDNGSDLLYFDIETAPVAGASDWIEPGDPPKNYTKPETIDAWKRDDAIKQLEKCALDLDLCRVVSIAWARNDDAPVAVLVPDLDTERGALEQFWRECREPGITLVGFNTLQFDLPVLVRRSQYLGVSVPWLSLNKHRHPGIMDLMQMLSFDGLVRARSQAFYCRRFGVTAGADDRHTGADIGRLVEAGDWEAVRVHVLADVEKTRALYRKVVRPVRQIGVAT
jgi:hypothetical protein